MNHAAAADRNVLKNAQNSLLTLQSRDREGAVCLPLFFNVPGPSVTVVAD